MGVQMAERSTRVPNIRSAGRIRPANFGNKPRAIRFVWGSKSPGMLARLAIKALQCGPWVKKVGHPWSKTLDLELEVAQ
ncbi:hypothetical protein J6590_103203, partial [Homalodisca vitripennis]